MLDADDRPERVTRAAALASAAPDTAWVTVATEHPGARADQLRDAGLEVQSGPEWMMTIELSEQRHHAVRAPYELVTDAWPGVAVVRVTMNGAVAASGLLGVVGTDAVADRIETDPAHRRRGLGSAVMSGLAAAAVRDGAKRGILVASSDGRQLYERLGWSVAANIVIARAHSNGAKSNEAYSNGAGSPAPSRTTSADPLE